MAVNRPRLWNDPADLPGRINSAADVSTVVEQISEFRRSLDFVEHQFRAAQRVEFDLQNYNRSLARLKNAVGKPVPPNAPRTRLHPWLEFAINVKAREFAEVAPDAPLLREHDPYVQQAAAHIAKHAKGLRGAPAHDLLRSYVAGLVVLFQEATGERMKAPRDKNSVYDPQLLGEPGRAMRILVDHLQPGISDTLLSRWVRTAQRKCVSSPKRFRDLYPGYGAMLKPGAAPQLLPPYRIDKLIGVSQPIYSP